MRLILLTLLLIALVCAAAQAEPARHVILVSIDGLKPEYYLDADRLGLKIPTLRAIMRGGSYARAMEPVLPPVTYPNHTTMVTGVRPMKHGIFSNLTVDMAGTHKGEWFWYAEDIKVTPLWDAVHEAGGTSAAVSWPVTVGAGADYNIPEYHRYGLVNDLKLLRVLSRPQGLVAEVEAKVGDVGGERLDVFIEAAASHIFEKYAPSVEMVHFLELDGAQHRFGPFSAEGYQALERIDGLLGKLWESARRRVPDVTLVVVSDHGFRAVEREIEVPVVLAQGGFGPEVYPLNVAGFCALYVAKGAPADTAQRLEAYLRSLRMPEITKVWSRADMDAWGAFPGASSMLEAADGLVFGSKKEGDPVVAIKPRGSHGFRPDHPDQQASFLAIGGGIRPGAVLPHIRMIDVAPTVAALLGIRLPAAEGRALTEVLDRSGDAVTPSAR